MTTNANLQFANPTEALDAIEQALQGIWTDVDTEEHYKTVPRVTDALAHLATLRQQVAELVAFRDAHQWQPIEKLTRGIKGEIIFIERIANDSCIEETFAGTYCDSDEYDDDWFDCFVNPSAHAIPFRDVVEHYTHFCVVPTPPAADGGQGC